MRLKSLLTLSMTLMKESNMNLQEKFTNMFDRFQELSNEIDDIIEEVEVDDVYLAEVLEDYIKGDCTAERVQDLIDLCYEPGVTCSMANKPYPKSRVLPEFVEAMEKIFRFGNAKYPDIVKGIPNYQTMAQPLVEDRKGSMERHSTKANNGITADPDHGESHYASVACNAMILFFHEQKNKGK